MKSKVPEVGRTHAIYFWRPSWNQSQSCPWKGKLNSHLNPKTSQGQSCRRVEKVGVSRKGWNSWGLKLKGRSERSKGLRLLVQSISECFFSSSDSI